MKSSCTSLDSSNFSSSFADFISSTSGNPLPSEVVHDFKRSLLDYISCILSGSAEPIVSALRECLNENIAGEKFFSEGFTAFLSATDAAFLNGVRAHALDFDDGYTQGSCHPGAVVFPAALAAARKYKSTPAQIIPAVVIGYDIMLRISAAMHPTTARNGFHNTSVAGVFGAAAAVSAIMGLDQKSSQHALGLAASFSGGILQFLEDGSDSKRLHAGKAARDGFLCAEMASKGITGPERGLEGKFGFFNAYARGEIRSKLLLQGLGEKFLISNTYFKLYPCCRHYHAAVDAARALWESPDFDIQQIEKIEIGLYAVGVPGHDQTVVHNLLEAQMSAPCAVALCLLDGNITNQSFTESSLSREELKILMLTIETKEDERCEQLYPSVRSGIVTIHLSNGKQLTHRVENPKGEEANPLSDHELEEKFIKNSANIISADDIDSIMSTVWNFEHCDSSSLNKIYQHILD